MTEAPDGSASPPPRPQGKSRSLDLSGCDTDLCSRVLPSSFPGFPWLLGVHPRLAMRTPLLRGSGGVRSSSHARVSLPARGRSLPSGAPVVGLGLLHDPGQPLCFKDLNVHYICKVSFATKHIYSQVAGIRVWTSSGGHTTRHGAQVFLIIEDTFIAPEKVTD